jgi:GNAT superfamily N-acetyltransferase
VTTLAITTRPGRLEDVVAEAELNQSVDWCFDERHTLAEYHDDAYEPSSVLIAELDGRVVGKLELFIARKSVYGQFGLVRRFVVADGMRGQGVGGQLLDAATRQARAAGCAFLELTVDVTNPAAHAFYKRIGFDEDRVEVIMRKPLSVDAQPSNYQAQAEADRL